MFRKGMSAELLPALRDFAPELLIISAGFDAHQLDPLGGLQFTDDDFDWITRELLAVGRGLGPRPRGVDPGRRLQPGRPGQRQRRPCARADGPEAATGRAYPGQSAGCF